MLEDSLPDRYGNALIDAWLAEQGRTPSTFSAVERLCYVGKRGMGALEYEPQRGPLQSTSHALNIDDMVRLASDILTQRTAFTTTLDDATKGIADILQIGTSAGGARAKAVIAWNPSTQEVRSGQVDAGSGFSYWLIKFDGVKGNRDKELEDPRGYGAIEFAYHVMAVNAGIEMAECRLLEENGRRHFMAKRFDRTDSGDKIHMQTLGALAHFDYNMPGVHSYEQAFLVGRQLGLPMADTEELFRRLVFNVVARNQDDHAKNIAFLMDRKGSWRLSPAYDVTYAYNPSGLFTSRHQMTLNGKRDGFTRDDLHAAADAASLKRGRWKEILHDVLSAVRSWPTFAEKAGLDETIVRSIASTHRLQW